MLSSATGNARASRTGKNYMQSSVSYRNPRQQEIWEMQSTHQRRLNWMHFKAHMEGHRFTPTETPEPVEIIQLQDPSLSKQEEELRKTLEEERKMLHEAKTNVQTEIDKCKKMLDEFRAQRQKKVAEKRSENIERRKLYERELLQLKESMRSDNSEIKMSIHRVDVDMDSSELNNSANIAPNMFN